MTRERPADRYWPATSHAIRTPVDGSRDRRPDRGPRSSPQLCCPSGLDGPTSPPLERGGGQQRDDSRPVRLRPPGEPGRGAADPQGPRGRGEAPLRRLQPHPPDQAPAGAAGPPRRHPRRDRPRRHRRDRRRAAHRRPGDPSPDPRARDHQSTATRCSTTPTGGIGDPQVRNWGTIGGSVAHADPASDWPAVLLAATAHDRLPRARPASGSSPARDFFLDTFQTAIEPTEVLTEIRFRRRPKRAGRRLREARAQGRRLRDGRRRVQVRLGDGRHASSAAGIGVTGVADNPFAATDAEAVLVGNAAIGGPVPRGRRRRRRAEPTGRPTSAVPSTTSGRWSPS